jgi:hypothetical protein
MANELGGESGEWPAAVFREGAVGGHGRISSDDHKDSDFLQAINGPLKGRAAAAGHSAAVTNWQRCGDIAPIDRLLRCCTAAFLLAQPSGFLLLNLGWRRTAPSLDSCEGGMNTTWHTKWGARRVRKDPPTIEEALIAAESMTDDLDQRVEIAASLIGASVEEVKALAAKQAHLSRGRSTLVTGRNRAVVVEYKRPRTIRPPGAARR